MTDNSDLLGEVEKLKGGLMTFSCGGDWDSAEYKRIRTMLLQDKNLKPMVPTFIFNYRDLSDYWQFIKVKFSHYAERRKFLVDEFSPLLNYFEFNDQSNDYSKEIKNKLMQWLSEAGKFDEVQDINRCEFILEPYPDVLISVNSDEMYDPFRLIIRAPRSIYDKLNDQNNGTTHLIYDTVNTLLNDHDTVNEIRILPLVGDTVFSHTSFSSLKFTTSEEIQETWEKLLDRITTDPEGSITTARVLVEDVCKYILDQLNEGYTNKEDLNDLYRKVAKKLSLAPENHQQEIFKQILGGCNSVVSGLASLRNVLGDAHGKGGKSPKPSHRHARLAVNLAITMALFLIETYQNKTNL